MITMITSLDGLLLTRREVFLLSGLLFLLLFAANNDLFSPLVSVVDGGVSRSDVVEESDLVKYPDPLLRWSDSVPETEIVAHSTGELFC